MNVSFKAAISLLISILLFAGFTVLAYTNLFDLIEIRFYNPSVARSSGRKIDESAKTVGIFLSELRARFAASLAEEAVQNSFSLNQQGEDLFERSRIYGTMLESQSGLQAVRFVDLGGSRIHFSTDPRDILQQNQDSITYRVYNDGDGELPFADLEAPGQEGGKITFDDAGERLIFSFPFHDSLDVYRGSALFYLSVRAVSERLVREGQAKIGDDVSVAANPGGFVLGLPSGERQALVPLVSSIWNEGILSPARLVSEETSASLVLVSAKTGDIFTGLLLDESLFAISRAMKIILLVSFFLTVYLLIFLFFNIPQDPVTVVENRLRRLRAALLEHSYDTGEEAERSRWNRELKLRREEIRSELKRGLKAKGGELDELIDRSWDELLSIIDGHRNGPGIDEKKLAEMLNRALRSLSVPAGPDPAPGPFPVAKKPMLVPLPSAKAGDFEELEEPEVPGVVSPVETGQGEEFEEVEELEELEELEEISGDAVSAAAGTPAEPEDPDEEPAELEELEEEAPEESPAGHPMTGERIDEIAREIEFADSPPEEDSGENFTMDLDIASPFDLMTFEPGEEGEGDSLSAGPDRTDPGRDGSRTPAGAEDEKKKALEALPNNEEELEELSSVNETGLEDLDSSGGLPCIYPPFSLAGFENLTILKILPDDSPATSAGVAAAGVIEEREGLHYISKDAFKTDRKTEQTLDREFKELVDSVLGDKA